MKKLLTAIALIACLILPLSVMAMTTISDNDLSAVTGQSGVAIGADITMNLSMGTVAWGDTDGLTNSNTGSAAGGWVGISNLAINNMRIHMRTDNGMVDPMVAVAEAAAVGITGTWGTSAATLYSLLLTGDIQAQKAGLLSILATEQLLTIDIFTGDGTTGTLNKTYVRVGIPTFEITMGDLTLNTGLWTNTATNTPGTFQSLGQVFVGGMTVLLAKNNFVDISQNNTASGVLIHVGNKGVGAYPYSNPTNKLMDVSFSALSWGDLDGLAAFPGTAGAGFIGLKGMNLAIGMDMYMNINVGSVTGIGIAPLVASMTTVTTQAQLDTMKATLLAGLAANDKGLKDDIAYILHGVGTVSHTSVDIALSGVVTVGTIATQVVLASDAALTANTGILGNIYIGGVSVTIPGDARGITPGASQSWVSISAH